MPQTLAAPCAFQEDIKKSRFAAHAAPVASVAEAMAFFAAHSVPEATHNCWAYRIGNEYRYHDDGEPGGTAGRPILQAIDGQGLDRVAVLVVRWFGGVKLGAGGLVRAYGGCAANCLRAGQYLDIIPTLRVSCRCGFAEQPLLRARLASAGAQILDEQFDASGVILLLEMPVAAEPELARVAGNITRGQSGWEVLRPPEAAEDG
ncbi:IMPACT family protein [Bordetella pseudohinzii]|uniref:IMPACT family member yigZ n=1 Tax=Bordetella pseudohinzii TaxID=1331258 RepID=A0A0J6C8X7_9BORD|nr:YigZ family protein [Bordetella pseudohinzii]ANY16368.1 thymidylate synthase [Bordetella pseudohinzii]KMM27508.1 thymidylate synthase [Bordetella pseudohinzii]KXA76654.1 thymidylate synthase [Bordetella pseudohinzii]KXA80684.1 thymidylate synthase [Bordetella pseudohinzii]CUI38737.1 IMPACT family member yigZ [Bordetella pseudohinzii]